MQTIEGSLARKASLQLLLSKAVLSVGTLIELREDFENMWKDALFQEICPILEKSQLDMRSQLNYVLLLFSTWKVSTGNFAKLTLYEQEGRLPERSIKMLKAILLTKSTIIVMTCTVNEILQYYLV